MSPLARTVEALLFLSPEPVTHEDLIRAVQCDDEALEAVIAEIEAEYAPGRHGIELRQLAGGFTFATTPDSEPAARRLLSNPRMSALTPPQAETLAIIGYLQPVSRPEITRIRGVNADSTTAMLLERGLIEITGRSDFGAVLYSTTDLFLKLFGLNSIEELPDPSEWDPTPEDEADLRERLLKAGEARAPDTLTGDTPELVGEPQEGVPQPTAS